MKKITKKDMLAAVTETALEVSPRKSTAEISLEEFLLVKGEVFGGANSLKLAVGAAAGPFTVSKIEKNIIIGKKFKTPTDRYTAEMSNGMSIGLPLAASFVEKMRKAEVKIGDVIYVARGDDYISKAGRGDCHSYMLKLSSRS